MTTVVGIMGGVLVLVLAGAIVVQTSGGSRRAIGPSADTTCAIDPPDGEVAISAAISGCPDGSTVLFPANRRYRQAHRILVADRRHLTLDGNGSTFITSSDGSVTRTVDGNWVILRGHDITIRNLTAIGSFPMAAGQARDLSIVGTHPAFTEGQMGIGLYGADTVHVHDVTLLNHWGDGVTIAPDEYVDGSTADYAANIRLRRITVRTVGRMCFAPTSGTNIWVEDSNCSNAWYGGLDAELDNVNQPLHGLHVLRNTFDGFTHLGVFVPVAAVGAPTSDIEIRDNRFPAPPDTKCAAPIHVGGYPDSNPSSFHNVVVAGNHVAHTASAIVLDHVDGGSITGNVLFRQPSEGGTPRELCGSQFSDPIRVTNSKTVAVGLNPGG